MTLQELAERFITDERPDTLLLDTAMALAQAIAATWFYAGYAKIVSAPVTIDESTEISVSEWAVIRPLFLLFIEREQALQLEASRGLGIDVFGRSVAEVEGDIKNAEIEMPGKAFFREIVNL
jgi:hypothetical protein